MQNKVFVGKIISWLFVFKGEWSPAPPVRFYGSTDGSIHGRQMDVTL